MENKKAVPPLLEETAVRLQEQITLVTDFFQERYGSPTLRITRQRLPMIPPALDAKPSCGFKWEVLHD